MLVLCWDNAMKVMTIHSFIHSTQIYHYCSSFFVTEWIVEWSTFRLIAPNVRQLQEGVRVFLYPEVKWVSHAPRMADSFIAKKSWRALLSLITWSIRDKSQSPLAEKSKERIHTASPIRYFYACTSSRHLFFCFNRLLASFIQHR